MNRIFVITALCVCVFALSSISFGQQQHKMSDIMKKGFKADAGPFKKAIAGKATDAELKQLYSYVQSLSKFKPKKGDAAAWKTKTDALLVAAKSLVDGDKTAAAKLKKAGNCKACHNAHKTKKK